MLNKPEIITLYNQGLSTRDIASRLCVSKSRVGVIIKEAGVSRTKSDAMRLANPMKLSTHWRTCRQHARRIWTVVNGAIPSRYHIHHKDGDYTNNDLTNLECLPGSKHNSLHSRGPEYTIPRHLRPARKEYMRKYLKEYRDSKT